MKSKFLLIVLSFYFIACDKKASTSETNRPSTPPAYQVNMVLEHNPEAFTQGLVYYDGKLYESTGGEESWIAEVDMTSGEYKKKVELEDSYFGEGITILNNKVYQLTWQSKTGFVYDLESFEKIREFTYDFEGWGITHDNQNLIVSDGTDKLHYLDTTTLQVIETVSIKEHGQESTKLNELEYINGYIYANQWQSSFILKIDPKKKEVIDRLDLTNLVNEIQRSYPEANVLNGIAFNPTTQETLVTGKLWPKAYVVRLR